MKQTLSKTDRLKSYTRIRQLFAKGQKLRYPPILIYYFLREDKAEDVSGSNGLQMGVSVGARYFKRAVDRNLLKRRIREAYRTQKARLAEQLSARGVRMDLFIVYIDSAIADYATLHTLLEKGLDQLLKKVNTWGAAESVTVHPLKIITDEDK